MSGPERRSRQRPADPFGAVLPEHTRDDDPRGDDPRDGDPRDGDPRGDDPRGDDPRDCDPRDWDDAPGRASDAWLRAQVPPHHG